MWIILGNDDFLLNVTKIKSISISQDQVIDKYYIHYVESKETYWTEHFNSKEECEKRFLQLKNTLPILPGER